MIPPSGFHFKIPPPAFHLKPFSYRVSLPGFLLEDLIGFHHRDSFFKIPLARFLLQNSFPKVPVSACLQDLSFRILSLGFLPEKFLPHCLLQDFPSGFLPGLPSIVLHEYDFRQLSEVSRWNHNMYYYYWMIYTSK